MKDKILLAHGSGGALSRKLVADELLGPLRNPLLAAMDDAAVFEQGGSRLAFTTDSYVVNPIFFPGGDIGKLAVCGTVNDLSMMGAVPRFLSLALIIEEGFPMEDLRKVVASIREASQEACVEIVTGDTKIVNRGSADKLFINTSGIGIIPDGVLISGAGCRAGDRILLNGTLGDHGIAVLSRREGLQFGSPVVSDCAPLNGLVADMISVSPKAIHAMRDPTRGGLAAVLNEFAEQSGVGIVIEEANLPVQPAVRSACEMLGLDPLNVANEGKLVACTAPGDAEKVVLTMRKHRYGAGAAVIGEVVADHPGTVVMRTRLGTSRIVSRVHGELLPRIC